jgi:uncharacterized membrane protein YeaQ/YmgE (transglycosylase-associated protein family)
MSLIAFLVIGLVAGLIARAVMPGNQSMGLLATTALGIVGSFVGGMLGSLLNANGNYLAIGPSGLIFSIIGAMAVLALVGFAGGRRVI